MEESLDNFYSISLAYQLKSKNLDVSSSPKELKKLTKEVNDIVKLFNSEELIETIESFYVFNDKEIPEDYKIDLEFCYEWQDEKLHENWLIFE